MSASIILAGLAWSLPDGRSLLSNLDLSFSAERAGLVGRNGVGKTTLLKLIAGELQPAAGSIAVGGRVGVLRQAVQVAPEEAIADLFGVREALGVLGRAERGEASADELAGADWTLGARMDAALARVSLSADAETRLAALSGGQRTRASLAALVFGEPDFLLLDNVENTSGEGARLAERKQSEAADDAAAARACRGAATAVRRTAANGTGGWKGCAEAGAC